VALDSADGAAVPRPEDAGAHDVQMEIEFDVVSVFRPRRIRLTHSDGNSTTSEVQVADEADPAEHDDPQTTVILWAYYEACRARSVSGARRLPWEHPHDGRTWRAFRAAMLAHPGSDLWRTGPAELLARAQAAYRACRPGFGE
jgi:hypothetical protein